jgi:hypothetical protein
LEGTPWGRSSNSTNDPGTMVGRSLNSVSMVLFYTVCSGLSNNFESNVFVCPIINVLAMNADIP